MQPIQFFAARAEDGALLPTATVDVFVHGSQSRAVLYSDSAGTSPLANPLSADANGRVFFYSTTDRIDIRISRGGYVAPLILDISTLDVATAVEQVRGEINAALGRIDDSLSEFEAEFEEVVARLGFESIYLEYAAGVIVQRASQLVRREGELYMVKDRTQVPLALTGVWLTDAAKLTAVGDAALRYALGEPESQVSVSGVPAYQLALRAKGDDYTVIRPGLRKIGASICGGGTQLSGVVTGDSLSFNGFGYVGWPTAGGGYATENPFGLSSWSHMLRDLFFTASTAFVPIQDVDVTTDATITFLEGNFFNFALNQKVVNFYFSGLDKKLVVQNLYTGAKCLIISYAPASEACLFEVDGVEYSNLSPDGHYQSRGFFMVPHTGNFATVTKVRYISTGQGGNLWFYGVGEGGRTVLRLTGKGAWTSGQILAEFSTLVAPYNPDYIIDIIGANDIGQGVTVAQFKSNLVDFIAEARRSKANCEIAFISTPPTSSFDRVTAKRYIKAMRQVVDDYGCSLIDLYSALEQVDSSYYRHDNIHFNRAGDTLVFNIVKNLLFPEVPVDYGKFTPDREALLGVFGLFYNKPRAKLALTALVHCVAAPVVAQYLGTPAGTNTLSLVYEGGGAESLLKITPPFGYVIDSIEPLNLGSATAARLAIHSIAAGGVFLANAVTPGSTVDVINSGIYALVNYRKI